MTHIFVDNFRGFQKTFFPIKDVTFLVGENSTGKSSLLSLLNLFSSPQLWFFQKFDTPEVAFTRFDDIVSVSSPDRSYFSIGVIEQIKSQSEGYGFHAMLMTFSEKDGLPVLSRFTYSAGPIEIHIAFSKKAAKYYFHKMEDVSSFGEFVEKVFNRWISVAHSDSKEYRNIPKENIDLATEPIFGLAITVQRLVENECKQKLPKGFRLPSFVQRVVWLAPIRTKPRRTYDEYKLDFSPEGIHTPYLIKKILAKRTEAERFKRFIEKVGRDSGLFEKVQIKRYGSGSTSPFELDIVVKKHVLSISNVGYGVSQSLPVIVEIFARPKESWFAIQQPEVHLHPKAQAALGDIFFELAVHEQKHFIVETHSDFTLDRFRLNYRRKESGKRPDAQVLFFERSESGNRVHALEIAENGDLPTDQPRSYREFFVREQMNLVGL